MRYLTSQPLEMLDDRAGSWALPEASAAGQAAGTAGNGVERRSQRNGCSNRAKAGRNFVMVRRVAGRWLLGFGCPALGGKLFTGFAGENGPVPSSSEPGVPVSNFPEFVVIGSGCVGKAGLRPVDVPRAVVAERL